MIPGTYYYRRHSSTYYARSGILFYYFFELLKIDCTIETFLLTTQLSYDTIRTIENQLHKISTRAFDLSKLFGQYSQHKTYGDARGWREKRVIGTIRSESKSSTHRIFRYDTSEFEFSTPRFSSFTRKGAFGRV